MSKRVFLLFMVFLAVGLIMLSGCGKDIEVEKVESVEDKTGEVAGAWVEDVEIWEQEESAVEGGKPVELDKELDEKESVETLMPQKIADLLAKGAKYTEMNYDYKDSQGTYNIFIKDNKMKIELSSKTKFSGGENFDTVYLDTDTKTAVGYCEKKSICDKYKDQEFEAQYEDYYKKTPLDWRNEIVTAEDKGPGEPVFSRQTQKIQYKKGNNIIKMLVGKYYGIILKVEEYDPIRESIVNSYEYDLHGVNVLNRDVTHQIEGE